MGVEELAIGVHEAERAGDPEVARVVEIERLPAALQRARLVAAPPGHGRHVVERPVGERVEALEQHGLELVALGHAGLLLQHDGDRGRQRTLDADRLPGEVGERARAVGLDHQHVDRDVSVDRQRDEIGLVGARLRREFAERTRRGELGLVGGDDGVVHDREAGVDLDVEAQLVVVAGRIGHQHLGDRSRCREVESGEVGDRAGSSVGFAPILGERLAGSDGRHVRRRGVVGVVPARGDGERQRDEHRQSTNGGAGASHVVLSSALGWGGGSAPTTPAPTIPVGRRYSEPQRCDWCQRSSQRSSTTSTTWATMPSSAAHRMVVHSQAPSLSAAARRPDSPRPDRPPAAPSAK